MQNSAVQREGTMLPRSYGNVMSLNFDPEEVEDALMQACGDLIIVSQAARLHCPSQRQMTKLDFELSASTV